MTLPKCPYCAKPVGTDRRNPGQQRIDGRYAHVKCIEAIHKQKPVRR